MEKNEKFKKWEEEGYSLQLIIPNSVEDLQEMVLNNDDNLILLYKGQEIDRFNIEDGDIIDQVEEEIVKHYYN